MNSLELFSMGLTYLPSEVNDLQHLQSLYLSNNAFTEFPKEICSLVNLKTLWIQVVSRLACVHLVSTCACVQRQTSLRGYPKRLRS
jgi:hypothetical protein